MLVGNKTDLKDQREVDVEQGQEIGERGSWAGVGLGCSGHSMAASSQPPPCYATLAGGL